MAHSRAPRHGRNERIARQRPGNVRSAALRRNGLELTARHADICRFELRSLFEPTASPNRSLRVLEPVSGCQKRKLEKYDQRLSPKMHRFGARSCPFTQQRHGVKRPNLLKCRRFSDIRKQTAPRPRWLAGAPGFEPGNDGIKIHLFCRWPGAGSIGGMIQN